MTRENINPTLRGTFHNIAEAIRARGISGTMTPIEMPTKITDCAKKLGVDINALIGDIDGDGVLQKPTGNNEIVGNGIISIAENALNGKFG